MFVRTAGELYGRGTTKRRTTCTGGRKRCHYTAGSDAQFKKQTGTRPGENQRRNNRFRRRECHLGPRCICVRFRNGKRRLLFHGTVRLPQHSRRCPACRSFGIATDADRCRRQRNNRPTESEERTVRQTILHCQQHDTGRPCTRRPAGR